MNQDCEQDDIASVGFEKAIGVWSRAKVFVTKRPAGVETLTFLFGKRDSAELLLTQALEAYVYTLHNQIIQEDIVKHSCQVSYMKAFDCAVNACPGELRGFGEGNKTSAGIERLAMEHTTSTRYACLDIFLKSHTSLGLQHFSMHLRPPTAAIAYRVQMTGR